MSNVFASSLYLFSALLQADATILGFGAIFIIYKLQTIDSRYQNALSICTEYSSGIAAKAIELAINADQQAQSEFLKAFEISMQRQFELILKTPRLKKEIRHKVKLPLMVSSAHLCICTVSLLIMAKRRFWLDDSAIFVITIVVATLFILQVVYIATVANNIVSQTN